MSVHERLIPFTSIVVLNLYYVCEHNRTTRKHEVFERGWMTVIFPANKLFCFGYSFANRDTRL